MLCLFWASLETKLLPRSCGLWERDPWRWAHSFPSSWPQNTTDPVLFGSASRLSWGDSLYTLLILLKPQAERAKVCSLGSCCEAAVFSPMPLRDLEMIICCIEHTKSRSPLTSQPAYTGEACWACLPAGNPDGPLVPGCATVLLPGIDLSPPALRLTEPRKNGHILSYLCPPAGTCLHRCCACPWLIMLFLFVCLFLGQGFTM